MLKERNPTKLDPEHLTKLYQKAGALRWQPDAGGRQGQIEKVIIHSMAKEKGLLTTKIKDVKLLGYNGNIKWKLTSEGLELTYPEGLSLKMAATFCVQVKG